tara:strand:+ start:828 stop:1946 length:1119 start_codon:yes stop_codon:yes gene_type:complete
MKKINIANPYFDKEDKEFIHSEIDKILDNKLSMGPQVNKFEKEFAEKLNVKFAIATNSCTAALESVLNAINCNGKEVILPAQTFIASGMSIYHSGAKPVFAEISKATFCLDIKDVRKKISSKTAAIMLVHMGGYITPDINDFVNLCNDKGIHLIEDAAHAPGAKINNKYAGSFGTAGCFSFFPTKVITSGEGGMIITNDEKIEKIARSFQNRGRDMSYKDELYQLPGRNIRMPEISALLGRTQLKNLEKYLKSRRIVADIYKNKLDNKFGVEVILPKDIESSSCWKTLLLFDKSINRDDVASELQSKGIQVDTSYMPPLHLQPVMKEKYNFSKGLLPITEELMNHHLCLPSHQLMTKEDAVYVSEELIKIIK